MGIIPYFFEKSDKNSYYQLLQKNFKKNYENNFEFNIEYASIKKNFIYTKPENEFLENSNYSWISYLLEQLNDDKNILRRDWKQFLFEDLQQRNFFNKYKYQNAIFFEELSIKMPKNKQNKTGEHFLESEPIVFPLNMDELQNYSEDNSNNITNKKTDVIRNFSFGSSSRDDINEQFLYNYTIDFDENESKINNPEDIMKYNSYILKKYIKIIRKQIEKKEHPIHIVIDQFIFFFESYLKLNIDFCKNNLHDENECNKKGLEVVKEIQNFIEIMQVTLKLFYIKSINFKYFVDEKDELINLISYILFNKKKFNKQLLDLFYYMNYEKKQKLELKFKNSQSITPKKIGINPKFCLDADSEEYWKEYKNKSKEKNESSIGGSTEEETNSKKKKKKLKKYVDDAKLEFCTQNEMDQDLSSKNPTFMDDNKTDINNNLINTDENLINFENFNLDKTYNEKIDINMKKKLLNDMENSILPNLPLEISENVIVLPDEPYSSAINYLRQIINYKVPLEKLIIVSYLSVLIMNNVDKYWENKKDELPQGFLNLDADEIMSIYLYIICKTNLSVIVDHLEFIKHFITNTTKQTIFGYYYSTFEGCIRFLLLSEEK